ncbi:hypothetical protein GCM10028818_02740 [Spirosoma horti]
MGFGSVTPDDWLGKVKKIRTAIGVVAGTTVMQMKAVQYDGVRTVAVLIYHKPT